MKVVTAMTIEQLYHFTEIYRQHSITQAAANLYVSRQALSLSLKKLEEEFATPLFTRLANGVEPTKAGRDFYRRAQTALNELSALKQDMLQYAPHKPAKSICRIGVVESILATYGDRLFTTLSAIFPHTYFDFGTIVTKENPEFYKVFDFSIVVFSDKSLANYTQLDTSRYLMKHIATYPIHIWVSASSPWNEYTTLTLDMLYNTPFCALKNKYSGVSFMNYLMDNFGNALLDNQPAMVLEKNFIDYIENFGYYTIDLPINKGQLLYTELFRDKNITLKATPQSLFLEVIYDRHTCQDYYPVIADILVNS